MTGPAAARRRPPKRPLEGAEWFAARLSLALDRTRRFTRWWLAVGGVTVAVAVVLPVMTRESPADLERKHAGAVQDTLRTATRLQQVRASLAQAESSMAGAGRAGRVARAVPSPTAPLATDAAADSGLTALERAIALARRERTRDTYLSLADQEPVRYGPRMRAFADSLRGTTQAQEVRRLGLTIVAMAENRRDRLLAGASGGTIATTAGARTAPAPDTLRTRLRIAALMDSVAMADSAHAATVAAWRGVDDALREARPRGPIPGVGLILLAVLLLGVLVRVGLALFAELNDPTIAHATEAERAVGAPVLTHVRDGLPEGALRFRPSGVDPFRVLYLALTATGTRTRSALVVGSDALIAAAAAARLAIAAAADHRNTMVAELDPELIALARIFRDHAEPGFTDAMAGAFAWGDVARPVGASDGLSLQMIPAGTARAAVVDSGREAAVTSFARFSQQFELSIVTASLTDLPTARALLPSAPVILVATLGETPVARLTADAYIVESGHEALHSIVLWDAPHPQLLSRAELAAQVSKRKGRGLGGPSRENR